jgi:hypothetical protein
MKLRTSGEPENRGLRPPLDATATDRLFSSTPDDFAGGTADVFDLDDELLGPLAEWQLQGQLEGQTEPLLAGPPTPRGQRRL